MKKTKFIISLMVVGVMLLAQVSAVFAAPTLQAGQTIAGAVQEIEVDTDPNTGLTTVVVTVKDEQGNFQTVRVSLETANIALGLVTLDGDGNPIINESLLGQTIEIEPADVIASETQNPVGSALATFFSDIEGLDYGAVMEAHQAGNGFGVIAQALWMTRKLADENSELLLGDDSWTESDIFAKILEIKNGGDYSVFFPDDESAPTNWGQFRKALLGGDKKANLGAVMSLHDENGGGNVPANNGNSNKDKHKNNGRDRSNNGNGNANGNRP